MLHREMVGHVEAYEYGAWQKAAGFRRDAERYGR